MLSSYEALAPERSITRRFQLKQGQGMNWYVVRGADATRYKLNLIDRVGVILSGSWDKWNDPARGKIRENPTNAYERLHKIEPSITVKFDEMSKVLTITSPPDMLFEFKEYDLKDLDRFIDKPPPDYRRKITKTF